MKTIQKVGHEQWLMDDKGNIKSVLMPFSDYRKILDLLEDYGLGKSMKEAEGRKKLNRNEALRLLEHA